MGSTANGLVNGGRTAYFAFDYDDTLSQARGVDVTNEVMRLADSDYRFVASWFPGVSLNLPINVHVANESDPNNLGGSWGGWGFIPLNVTLKIGEGAVFGGSAAVLLRYLLVSEISEIFMREGHTAWFATFDEGAMGEGLSRFLAAEFLLREVPGTSAIPSVTTGTWAITDLWLNSGRNNYVDHSDDDIQPDDKTGCTLLFINFLHYQLGFDIGRIVGASGDSLAKIYVALTGDAQSNAWPRFKGLVDAHCPQGGGAKYFPPLDNVFPVSDLDRLYASPIVTWVDTPTPARASLGLNEPAAIAIEVMTASDDPQTLALPDPLTLPAGAAWANVPLTVVPIAGAPRDITLTASYAGKSLSTKVTVVRPQDYPLPALVIAAIRPEGEDRCVRSGVEGREASFAVSNLGQVFASRKGLSFQWKVHGAAAAVTDSATLLLPALPAAGTQVTLSVSVRNAQSLHATGTYSFKTAPALSGIAEMQAEVKCRVQNIKNINQVVLPGDPVENPGQPLSLEALQKIESQAAQVIREAEGVIVAVKKIAAMKAGRG